MMYYSSTRWLPAVWMRQAIILQEEGKAALDCVCASFWIHQNPVDCWLGFSWFTATLGYCSGQKLRSSESRFPPGDRSGALNPVTHVRSISQDGESQVLSKPQVTRVFRVFLSILSFSSSPTYLPTLPIFLLLKLPKKWCFIICPMFSCSSLNFRVI